jgi:hypothetical protein
MTNLFTERVLPFITKSTEGHWRFKLGDNQNPKIQVKDEYFYVKRIIWEAHYGPILSGLRVQIKCSDKFCMRPEHMYLASSNNTLPEINLKKRFDEKYQTTIDHEGKEHWIWLGAQSGSGYPVMYVNGKLKVATHVSIYLDKGVWIEPGKNACHHCDIPLCVNPACLFIGTDAENRLDCVLKNRHAKGDTHGTKTKPESVKRGEENGRATITEIDAAQIRLTLRLFRDIHGTVRRLGKIFSLDDKTITDIGAKNLWQSISGDNEAKAKPLSLADLFPDKTIIRLRKGKEPEFYEI